ncbi:putative oxoglutarate/iron-dependent dioxygenase, non-heme dioxygenase domain-containing protein [Helianthus annuus]|nr:putative oxoglutarate/iron-dependent dioxygenase, non-heme dioxygenase domain-containing protein [Helianthus annuus]KAJ0713415.1 putative oxoglutarate/iron-dependent dioxygenase, non-heme dioxygenase domain-containing protein [Helianthus annuus]
MASLPVINVSVKDLNSDSSSWAKTCDEVVRALEEYGCFIAVYDGVSSQLHDAIFAASQQVLDLPYEVKILNTSDGAGHGYFGQSPKNPGFERLTIEKATTKEGVEAFTKLMWPSGNDTFRHVVPETASTFVHAVAQLEEIVMKMVAKSYGVEQHYEPFLGSTDYILKFNKYESPKTDEPRLGLFPHTDKSFITILHQKEQGKGLEIKTKDQKWVEVDLSPSGFVFMAGDACTAWTNGRMEAPVHRVMMEGKKDRFSMVVSSYIRDLEIQAPQELIDEEHPVQYKPFEHYKYIDFHTYQNSRKLRNPLKHYCGV